jgi:hypothetical protein
MSTKGRLTDVEQTVEALAGAIRALEARVEKLEGAVAARPVEREPAPERGKKTPEGATPSLNGVWANDQASTSRDRAMNQVVASIGQLADAVKQLQEIIEPDDPVPIEVPVVAKPATGKPVAAGPVSRERRKLPQVRRADEEFEKAAAAELAEHEAWLQDLRQRLTGGQASEDRSSEDKSSPDGSRPDKSRPDGS